MSAQSLLEVGVDLTGEQPKAIDPDLLARMDYVITLGGEAKVEEVDGPTYLNWDTDEPSERGIDGIERMRLVQEARGVSAPRVRRRPCPVVWNGSPSPWRSTVTWR